MKKNQGKKNQGQQKLERELHVVETEQFETRSDIWTSEQREAILRKHQMQVRVSSFDKGVETYIGVHLIRIRSRFYNILILRGFQPSLGEIDGEVSFVVDEDEITYSDIRGFYCFRDNTLYLMIREVKGSGVSMGVC